MKTTLLMNFTVDKENKKVKVERAFNAPLADVWAAYTDPRLLDQWWAPKPYKAVTKSMDFREGGRWLYYMLGPEGDQHWSLADYLTIEPHKKFTAIDAFCDEHGQINMEMPRSKWKNEFRANGASTVVHIEITWDKAEDLEKIMEMGFKEGFTMAMENLDAIFADRK